MSVGLAVGLSIARSVKLPLVFASTAITGLEYEDQ
jgi:hypothetical protein